jgi:hypothetical protein
MSDTDLKTVGIAQEGWAAARRALQLADNDEKATSANRAIYKALSEICRAYLSQFADTNGLPRPQSPKEQFPPEAALMFRHMIEGWLVGHIDQSLLDLLHKTGTPGRTLIERSDIEHACRYMQAATGDNPLIDDSASVKRIGGWFGVNRATAQSWKRAEHRDLLADYMPNVTTDQRAAVIKS